MGLDENRFNSEVDEEFRCSICRDIIEDPIATQCEHVFCKLCINKWLQKDFSCPVDRKPLNNSQLCEPNRFFRNFYLKLELKCEFESNGCKKFCKIEDLFNHQKKCKYNPIVEYECEKECGALLTMKDEASHNCVQYLKNLNFVQKKELTKMCERETLNNELLIDMRSIVSAQYQEINGLKLKSDITNSLLKTSQIIRKYFYLRMRITLCQNSLEKSKLVKDLSRSHTDSRQLIVQEDDVCSELKQLVDKLKADGIVKTQRVENILLSVDRKLFLTSFIPYADIRWEIGFGSTISAPHIHAYILELLDNHLINDSKVLDIGSGSGYLTICMSKMVSGCGKVIGIDHIKPLVEKSQENVRKNFAYLLHKLKFITSDGRNGYSSEAPYDVINIGGGVTEVPQTILDQLKIGGRIIAPIQRTNEQIQHLVTIDKLKDGSIKRKRQKRVFFEPLKSLV